jgi:UDP-N-acetylmuramate--alanine ligase
LRLPKLEGRRIWFVGIGGAGLSGYALLARAWGAEVGGWDRVETPYMCSLADMRIELSPEPVAPVGWEVVVSTAYTGQVEGRTRADFLAELVSLQDAIVVAGTHGKSTTAAMIAFVLRELGRDPAFLIGADVRQLGGNAGAGEGWLVVEGDESDGTIEHLRPTIAVVTNVELDHHSTFASVAELEELFARWLPRVPHVATGPFPPLDAVLDVPGEHNRRNAAAALAALTLAGIDAADATPVLALFRGVGRRFEARGEAGGVSVYDDYAHHPTEVAATIAAAREGAPGRVVVLFQPHLYSRTRHLAHDFGRALATADAACVTDIYRARETPVPGVSGKLVVDAVADTRPGMPVGWAPTVEEGAELVSAWARPGDLLLTVGAGDVDRAAELVLARLASRLAV